MNQLHFLELDETEIDVNKTKAAALSVLKKYRAFKQGATAYNLKVTASYSIEPKAYGNEFRSNVEDNVIRKLDYMMEVENAVSRMNNADERQIIIEGYLSDKKHDRNRMCEMLCIENAQYYRKRISALINFAYAINKEVYMDQEGKQRDV